MQEYASFISFRAPGTASGCAREELAPLQAQLISLFKLGIERSGEAIFLTDLEGKILYVNPAFEKIYGYQAEEVLGKTPRILKSGCHTQEFYADFWRRLLDKEVMSGELTNKTKDGRLLTIESSANPVLDDQGRIVGFLAIQRDITERKALEENEQSKTAFLSSLVGLTKAQEICESAFDFIKRMAPCQAGAVILENKIDHISRYEVIYNFDTNEDGSIISRENREIVELDPESRLAAIFRSGQEIIEHRSEEDLAKFKSKEQRFFIFNERPSRSLVFLPLKMKGQIIGALTVQSYLPQLYNEQNIKMIKFVAANLAMALTAVKSSESLNESESRFKGIFFNATTGLYRTTPEGRFLMANPAMVRMLGYDSFEELAGENLDHSSQIHQYPRPVFKAMMETIGVVHGLESTWRKSDGSHIHILESACAIRNENGKIVYYEGTAEDITERKKAEEKLQAQQEELQVQNEELQTNEEDLQRQNEELRVAYEELKEAEEAIKIESDRAQSYLNTAGVIFVAIDNDARIQLLNRKGHQVLGYAEGELIGKNWFDTCLPGEETGQVKEVHKRIIAGEGEPFEYYENRVVTKTGEMRDIAWHNAVVRDAAGKIVYVLSSGEDITKRKRTERELEKSNKRFHDVALSLADLIWEVDAQGRYTYVSDKIKQLLGYEPQELLGKTPFDLMPPEEAQKVGQIFGPLAAGKEPIIDLENWNLTKNGGLVCLLTNGMPILGVNGELLGYRGVDKDITERKRAEEVLRDSEERFRMIFETGPFPMVLSNKSFKFIKANAAFCGMLGYSEDEITRLSFKDITHPDYLARDTEAVLKVCSGELPVYNSEKRYLRKDGSIVWGSLTLSRISDKEGRLLYMMAMVEDITERKQAEKALRDSEERYKLLIENANDGIFVIQNSKIAFVNHKVSAIIGYEKQEIVDKSFSDFVHPDDREQVINRHQARMAGQQVESNYSLRVLHKNGSVRWMEVNVVRIDWQGSPATLIFGRDVTSRKQAEEALRASEERYKLLIENANDAIFVVRDFKIIYSNDKIGDIIGYNSQEITDKLFGPLIHQDDREMVSERHKARMAGQPVESTYTFRVLRKDGSTRWLEINAVKIDWHGEPATLNFGRDVTERLMAEAQLQIEKAYFERLFESAPEAILVGDINGKITRTNPEFTRVFGYLQEEAIGKYVDDIIAPEEYRKEAVELTSKVARGETIISEGVRYRRDGQPVYVSIMGTPINTSEGQIAVYAIYRDISEQKKAENLNLARTNFLSKLVGLTNASDLAILTFDHVRHFMPIDSGALVIADERRSRYELVFSADTEENGKMTTLTNRGYIDMDPTTPTDHVFLEGQKYIKHRGEAEVHNTIPLTEGMPAYNNRVSSSLAYFPLVVHGRAIGVFSFLSYQSDIFTDSRINLLESIMADLALAIMAARMTEALKSSEEKYRYLVETMPNGLLLTDCEQHITYANEAACQIFRYDHDRLIGLHIQQLVTDESRARFEEESRKRQNGEHSEYEIVIRGGDGQTRMINIMAAPTQNAAGEVTGTIGIFNDVTEIKNSEIERQELREKLSRAQRMESLGVLAGGVAHDLNNILGPLVAYPELIRMKLPPDSPVIKQISKIEASAQRAAEVVQDLLAMARRGRYEMKPISINKVVESYLQSPDFYELKLRCPNVNPEFELGPENQLVYGSEAHLYKVIMNLVHNAMDAMPHGGELGIKTQFRRIERLNGGYDNIDAGQYAIITVTDTGIGIEAKDYKRLFEPFYTKKEMGRSGSGLGLAIVYGVIKDHNGYIDVHSEVNKGSEFVIYIPATTDTAAIEEHEPHSIKGNERILIVDDVPEQRELAVTILGSLGYKAECVPDGRSAVRYMEKKPADVVVLDMIMEPGFDGLDTYRAILEGHPGQKAIITSGFSETDRVKEAERLGVGRYIRKPYTMQKLGRAIREVLDVPA